MSASVSGDDLPSSDSTITRRLNESVQNMLSNGGSDSARTTLPNVLSGLLLVFIRSPPPAVAAAC